MKLNLIYCKNKQNIIGYDNNLLFTIREDMKYFKKITTQEYILNQRNVVIMGYNTWKSIPEKFRPLQDRLNIVITTNHYNDLKDEYGEILVFKTFEDCYKFLEKEENNNNMLGNKFIIGGGQLYNHIFSNYLMVIDKIYETIVNYNLIKSEHTHYTSLNHHIDLYPELDFNIEKFTDKFISINKKYCDEHSVVVKCNNVEIHGVEYRLYQNKENINYDEKQYLDLMKKILFMNNIKTSRNSIVISQFSEKMTFDLRKGFPLLTTKKMPFKTILRELLWFINGSTDNNKLNEKNVHIWDGNASKEFLSGRGLDYEENDLGPVYGFQWRHCGAKYINRTTDYSGQGVDQLQNVIDLINKDPGSRRIILSAWNPSDIDKMALPPCHVMVQFNIDNEYIDAQLYQRSGDMFLGIPFNIASYALLLHIIGSITGYIPRHFHHVLGNAHIYMNHLNPVAEQIHRIPNHFPKLVLKEKINDINMIDENIFEINDYNYYPRIKAEMIA